MPLVGKIPSGPWVRNNRMVSKEAEEEEGGPWLNLWLGNLSPDTVDEDLMAVFANYGAMDSVTSYLPRPYAFVYFRTIEDAKAAKQALHGIVIRGKPIRIEFARPAKPGKTLWVGGISQSVTKVQLENVFTKFGEIEEYRFLRHRGSAFICFHRIEDAIAAQKSMNWKHLGGSEIRVDFQRSPLRRDWNGEHDYMGSKNFILTDQLLSTDEMKYFHDSSPHPGVKRQPPQGKRKDEQLSNVLWVGYPSELQIDEELLHNSMILFGEIERIQSFPSRNYCYVEFRSVDEARRAKEGLQGRLLGDNRIQILFSNSELIPGKENPPLSTQEIFFNEPPPMGPVELFGPGHSLALNHFPGHLAPNVMPRANILIRPFNQGFDPHHGGSDFHEFGGGIHSFPENIINNPMASNLKKLSPSAPGIIAPGLVVHPPFRPLQPGRDEFDIREPKRSRLDTFFPPNDAHFPGRIVDVDDMSDFSGLPHPDRNILSHRQQTPDIRGHDHLRASPGIDYCWRGIIAKGGTPVCRARCLPIGNGIEAPFPDIVNCSARTGLDMLTTHYSEAVGFDMVFFLPDSEDDFASYTEFLRYLGQRDRAGVAKFDDGTTMFLVPPSDFLTKVLKYSGPERLYGVVLKLPQQNTTPGHQLQQPIMPPPSDTTDPHLSQKSYGFMTHNEDQSLKSDYGSSSHERPIPHYQVERPPRLAYSEEPHPIPSVSQDHSKIHETAPEVSLTPELIATLASLMPTNAHPSSAMPSHMPSNSASMPASFSAPPVNDNSMLMQGWGQQGNTAFSNAPVEQIYNPMQNFLPPMHQYSNQTPLIPQFPNYANSTNGMDNPFQPSMAGIPPMQEPSLHIQQVPGIYGTIGNTVSSQGGQFQAFQSNQATDVASMYGMPVRHQITPANPVTTHNVNVLQVPMDTPVISDRLNANFPTQAQQFHAVLPGSGQEGDADKDQRYHSTLQFAASLLLQIQQQQQAKAQAALGSGNQQ